jgi:branched-chain amino acid transport system substrate-binding protein
MNPGKNEESQDRSGMSVYGAILSIFGIFWTVPLKFRREKIMKRLVCGILAAALFAGGGAETKGSSAGAKVLKFGVLAPLTGTNAEYGKGFQVGMQMRVDRLNAAGGVNGYTFELVIRDSKGDAKESSDLARQFADDDEIYAILGDFTSGACMANAPIVDEAGIVQLSPTASNPAYASMSPYCFSIMGRQDSEAPMYARLTSLSEMPHFKMLPKSMDASFRKCYQG